MVQFGDVYVVVLTAMALVALAAALPVLVSILIEGRERWRDGAPDTPERPAGEAEMRGPLPSGGFRCGRCGTVNERGFRYCRECVETL
ncbi:zinc ribbon domain-containing protein [Halomicroarcula sp. GCM10025324]|jgi:hypothetical protein|uniref:DUF7577 domain-containing protein n=1 Tax=Haloarcula TaxID=2237 RepID=UPI0023E8D876|nr:hypothetical protein [Halomicroarcula sp. ZS-22-S1]